MNNGEYLQMMNTCNNIEYCKRMIALSSDPRQITLYENLLMKEIDRYNQLYRRITGAQNHVRSNEIEVELPDQKKFTLEELSQYDGSGGRPAYVAVNNVVYDVSLEATWGGGTHFSLYAGKDLTDLFNACHRGMTDVLRNLPQVGVLV
ncbi:MAG: cytochrome b5 domain-containing protein [Sedimentibacter sp.]|uniref:cytochrome b5 domain-containing protein n=1 Tax=Sedimentibacter sp. TaxID=1960295 RepID=UPI00315934EF